MHTLASAPPCAMVADLVMFREIRKVFDTLDEGIVEKKDFIKIKKNVNAQLAPTKDLVSQAKLRSGGMSTRKKAFTEASKLAKSAVEGATAPTVPVMGLEQESGVDTLSIKAFNPTSAFSKAWFTGDMQTPPVVQWRGKTIQVQRCFEERYRGF